MRGATSDAAIRETHNKQEKQVKGQTAASIQAWVTGFNSRWLWVCSSGPGPELGLCIAHRQVCGTRHITLPSPLEA